jgi:hypothetical protein
MRLVKNVKGYWGILKDVSLEVDGVRYWRQKFIIGLGVISKDSAMALLKDLEDGRAEVREDEFGHKFIHYKEMP